MKVVTKKQKANEFIKRNWKKIAVGTTLALAGSTALYLVLSGRGDDAAEILIDTGKDTFEGKAWPNGIWGFENVSLDDLSEMSSAMIPEITGFTKDQKFDEVIFVMH